MSGGDPVCWLGRVCPECGALVEFGTVCPRCDSPLPDEHDGPITSDEG